MNKEIIELRFSLPVDTFTGKEIYDIFLTNLWFVPAKFYGKGITYGSKVFRKKYFEKFKNQEKDFTLQIWDNNENDLIITEPAHRNTHQAISLRIHISMYEEVYSILKKYVLDKVIVGYAHQYYDAYLQRAYNATAYRVKKMEPPKDKIYYDEEDSRGIEYVDISNNPGRDKLVSNMWLTSTWRMWFGKKFYKEVDKTHLKNFKQADQIEELDNNILFIQLYDDPFKPELAENRNKQQAFRDHIKMEELIERLK
ncbi:hypothetical protein [Aquimarina algiphila]|uniref:Uncharacterized protein n=1 Tax=Aquimarina algiphila TaxID=2047982 RepID=A0A554VD77_9FLAO|nr:hypothetical protein [Aquimarina algiphila]TSE04798.1 hypothetical protein FOF46_25170 [Aquimarina algiphila]